MKLKHLLSYAFVALPLMASAQIQINETNFPDENFRNYLREQDYGQDGVITDEEIKSVTSIDVDKKNISSLKGIEFFTALTKLTCGGNQLTAIDVSNNTELEILYCGNNQLSLLDVSKNTLLWNLDCHENQLTSLDVSKNTSLSTLQCQFNKLKSLDLSTNTALTNFNCTKNELASLNVPNSTNLLWFYCDFNKLTSLDISKHIKLFEFTCSENKLTSLDLSKNVDLRNVVCGSNSLTSLDVSKNTVLRSLHCGSNQLTSLDISNNTVLRSLYCYSNQLTSLDVSANTALKLLECYSNQIKGKAMDILIESLHNQENAYLYIYDKTSYYGIDGNICTKSHVATARSKGWTPYYIDYVDDFIDIKEYEGSDAEPNDIAMPTAENIEGNAPIYNLAGQRITQPTKGSIYIKNGKKVFVKQ